jgi:hypothetical protein
MQIVNFEITRGDSWARDLYFTDDGVALDITGYIVFLTAKEKISDIDASAKISKTITVVAGVDATNGKCTISLSTAETAITVGSYVYDIQIKSASGTILTIVTGTITILSDVTIRIS